MYGALFHHGDEMVDFSFVSFFLLFLVNSSVLFFFVFSCPNHSRFLFRGVYIFHFSIRIFPLQRVLFPQHLESNLFLVNQLFLFPSLLKHNPS